MFRLLLPHPGMHERQAFIIWKEHTGLSPSSHELYQYYTTHYNLPSWPRKLRLQSPFDITFFLIPGSLVPGLNVHMPSIDRIITNNFKPTITFKHFNYRLYVTTFRPILNISTFNSTVHMYLQYQRTPHFFSAFIYHNVV